MLNYSQVEWLQNSTNQYSYIELNYYPSSATKIELDAAFFTGGSSYSGIFGIFTNDIYKAFWANVTTDRLTWEIGNVSPGNKHTCYDNTNYRDGVCRKYTFENGAIYVNDIKTASCDTQTVASWGYKLNWFIGSANWTGGRPQRVYEIKIYELIKTEYILKLDLIPVIRWRDKQIGLLNKVNDDFYPAPSGYTRGKILTDYTPELELRVNYQRDETVNYYISEDSKNFKIIDNAHPTIKNKDVTLTALLTNIDQKFATDASEKDAIWRLINNKLDIVDDKNTVLNTLITKLNTDYTKAELAAKIASNEDLQEVIAAICDTIMTDYYTKAEVDELVSAGSGGSMTNYYTKTEIDALIPEKEDLSKVQEFLEGMDDYYLALKTFTGLNGKGD